MLRVGNAGIVDQDRDQAQSGLRPRGDGQKLIRIGHIELQGERLAARGADFGGGGFEPFDPAAGERYAARRNPRVSWRSAIPVPTTRQ